MFNQWLEELRARRILREGDKGAGAGGAASGVAVSTEAGESVAAGANASGNEGGTSEGSTDAYLEALGISPELLLGKKPAAQEKKADGQKPAADDAAAGDDKGGDGKSKADAAKSKDDDADEFETPAEHRDLPHVTRMKGRIGKLTAQRNEARERISELESELKSAKDAAASAGNRTAAAASGEKGPFAGITTRAELDRLAEQARATEDWAEQIEKRWEESGGEADLEVDDGKGGKQKLTPAQVKDFKRQASRILRDLSQQEKLIGQREFFAAEAVKHFPWIEDEADGKQALLKAAFEKIPGLKLVPDGQLLAAALAEGMDALRAKIAAAKNGGAGGGKPAAKETTPASKAHIAPPPPLGGAGGGGAAPKTQTVVSEKSEKNVADALASVRAAGGSEDALAEYYRTLG